MVTAHCVFCGCPVYGRFGGAAQASACDDCIDRWVAKSERSQFTRAAHDHFMTAYAFRNTSVKGNTGQRPAVLQ